MPGILDGKKHLILLCSLALNLLSQYHMMLCDTNFKRWSGRLGLPISKSANIKIEIDHHFHSKVYTSGSTISGNVTIRTQKDLSFDGLEICLTGKSQTQVGLHTPRPLRTSKTFLHLSMPFSDLDIPESRIFQAGTVHRIPFTFVIPHQLSMGACSHKCSSPMVRDLHLQLPPSMGSWDFGDLSPDMTRITYGVETKIFRKPSNNRREGVLESFHQINVLPYLSEDAPLHISHQDKRYRLHQTKKIRKGLTGGSLSHVSATTFQPRAIKLSSDGLNSSNSSVKIAMGFTPSREGEATPQLNSISAKINTNTFLCLAPMEELPDFENMGNYLPNPDINYPLKSVIGHTETKSLPMIQRPRVIWERRFPSHPCSEKSSSSSISSSGTTELDPAQATYAFTLDLNLVLPFHNGSSKRTIFLPTFHPCLISRTYTITLDLSFGPHNTTISLAIPLQIVTQETPDLEGNQLPVYSSEGSLSVQRPLSTELPTHRDEQRPLASELPPYA